MLWALDHRGDEGVAGRLGDRWSALMPAEVGYGPSVNLAAEVSRPAPQQASGATRPAAEAQSKEEARESTSDERREVSAAGSDQGGNTTADRGQNVNITA